MVGLELAVVGHEVGRGVGGGGGHRCPGVAVLGENPEQRGFVLGEDRLVEIAVVQQGSDPPGIGPGRGAFVHRRAGVVPVGGSAGGGQFGDQDVLEHLVVEGHGELGDLVDDLEPVHAHPGRGRGLHQVPDGLQDLGGGHRRLASWRWGTPSRCVVISLLATRESQSGRPVPERGYALGRRRRREGTAPVRSRPRRDGPSAFPLPAPVLADPGPEPPPPGMSHALHGISFGNGVIYGAGNTSVQLHPLGDR